MSVGDESSADAAYCGDDAVDEGAGFLAGDEATVVSAPAEEGVAPLAFVDERDLSGLSGFCGAEGREESVSWELVETAADSYTLKISGAGDMADYETAGVAPWHLALADKKYETAITRIEIGKDIVSVGDNAFVFCKGVQEVAFEEGSVLESIGLNGFHSLAALKIVELPASLQSIGGAAFYGCSALETVSLMNPDHLVSIEGSAFGACKKLSSFNASDSGFDINIPKNVVAVGDRAFQQCATAKSAFIPAGVETLDSTFYGCSSLSSVVFAEGSKLKSLKGSDSIGVFHGTVLKSVDLPEGLEEIGKHCFSGSSTTAPVLESIVIPSSVKSIGFQAFRYSKLKELTLEEGSQLKELGDQALGGCSLEAVYLPEGLESMGADILAGTDNVKYLRVPSTLATDSSTGYFVGLGSFVMDLTRTDHVVMPYNNSRVGLIYLSDETATQNYPAGTACAFTNGGIFTSDFAGQGVLMVPEKENCEFGGWYTDAKFENEASKNNDGSYAYASGQKYYAKWSYDIAFDGNGATSGSMPAQNVAEGSSDALNANAFAKTGYTFMGWNTAADGMGQAVAADALASSVAAGSTLYAQWKANAYTVVFDANGGTGEASVAATYDEPIDLPSSDGFAKAGFKLDGWSLDPDAAEAEFACESQALNLAQNEGDAVTLYAVWGAKPAAAPNLDAQTKTYNGTPQAFDIEDGFTVEYQQDGASVEPKNVGLYDVVISAPETDETAAYHAVVYDAFEIAAADLTVSAKSEAIYIGDALPALSYSIDGWQGEDTEQSTGLSGISVSCPDVELDKAGSYAIEVEGPDAIENYAIGYVDGTLTVRSHTGGAGSSTDTTIEHNDDGSVTTTIVHKDTGVVEITTEYENGVVVRAVDAPNEPVDVTVEMPDSVGAAVVKIPFENADGSTVAVDIPTGKAIVLSVATDGGILVKLEDSAHLTVERRAVEFGDASGHWGEESVAFVAARGLFSGVSEGVFDPDTATSRAMLMTVLARFCGQDVSGGDGLWYERAVAWAVDQGISNGDDPEGFLTREQMVTMMWRLAGAPAITAEIDSFPDAGDVSEYAVDAMGWAVGLGYIQGENGLLNPQGGATRAQLATVMERYIEQSVL